MHLAVAGIDHQPFHIWLVNELLKQSLPHAPITPPAESSMRVLPVAVAGGKITPRGAGAQNPEDGVYKAAIVLRDASPLAALSRKMLFKETPGGIRELVSSCAFSHCSGQEVVNPQFILSRDDTV